MAGNPRKNISIFDPQRVPANASRNLTDLERAAIWIYLEKMEDIHHKKTQIGSRDNLPDSAGFVPLLRRRLFDVFRERGSLDFITPGEARREYVRAHVDALFRGLYFDQEGMDLRDTTPIGQIIRRIVGLGALRYSDDELRTALKSLDRYMQQSNPDYIPGTLRIQDVRDASNDGWIVPELGFVIPSVSSFIKRFADTDDPKMAWAKIREAIFGIDISQEEKRRNGITLDDIEKDYRDLADLLRITKKNPTYVPKKSDIIERWKNDRRQFSFQEYCAVLRNNGLNFDLFRRSLGFSSIRKRDNLPRTTHFSWLPPTHTHDGRRLTETERTAIAQDRLIDGYISLWARVAGLPATTQSEIRKIITTTPPPTKKQMDDIAHELTAISRERDLQQDEIMPSQGMINDYFGGKNQLLAKIEEKYGVEVYIGNASQLNSLVAVAVPKDPNKPRIPHEQLPARVRERVI